MQDEKQILVALKKARTSLENVISMVEGKSYCVDIMQQNLAVIGLLRSANERLFERHLGHCFTNAMNSADKKRKRKMIDEVLKLNTMSR